MSLENCKRFLQDTIFPDLEKGRSDFDKPHTKAVVEHTKGIVDNSSEHNLDRDVLIIAAYAHDWGYSGLFRDDKPLDYDGVSDAKKAHMKIGADKLKELLKDEVFSFLSEKQKLRVIHLVQVHDDLKVLKDTDELVLMEADTLGSLDVEKVKPTYDKTSNDKYMEEVLKKRFPLFVTEYGKKQFRRLYEARKSFYSLR